MSRTTVEAERMQFRAEQAPFVMLPRWLLYHPEVAEGAKFLYCVLHDMVAGREGPTRPVTRAELAGCCRVSVDTIDRRLTQLVAVGAVEKQAQVQAGGQVANVYQMWLTPPDGLYRRAPHGEPTGPLDNRGRKTAAPVEGCAKPQVNRGRKNAAPPAEPQPGRQPRGDRGRIGAAPFFKEVPEEEIPPQPPRSAGGPADASHNGNGNGKTPPAVGGRRADGTSLRAMGANPRAEDQLAAAAREQERAAQLEAEAEAKTAARIAAERAAEEDRLAFEAESLAVSGVLDDDRLAVIVDLVTRGLAGPLARSPLAVSRGVLSWCRAAARELPGGFVDAVDRGLAQGLRGPADEAPRLVGLPAPAVDTAALRARVDGMLRAESVLDEDPGVTRSAKA